MSDDETAAQDAADRLEAENAMPDEPKPGSLAECYVPYVASKWEAGSDRIWIRSATGDHLIWQPIASNPPADGP